MREQQNGYLAKRALISVDCPLTLFTLPSCIPLVSLLVNRQWHSTKAITLLSLTSSDKVETRPTLGKYVDFFFFFFFFLSLRKVLLDGWFLFVCWRETDGKARHMFTLDLSSSSSPSLSLSLSPANHS